MKVEAILAEKGGKVVTVAPDAAISTAVSLLRSNRIGALIVSGDGETVEGVLSERDIVNALEDHPADLPDHKVSELMTKEVHTCVPSANIAEVMATMTNRRFRHLPVVENGKLLGMISIGDVVKNRLEELESETSAMRDYVLGGRT